MMLGGGGIKRTAAHSSLQRPKCDIVNYLIWTCLLTLFLGRCFRVEKREVFRERMVVVGY